MNKNDYIIRLERKEEYREVENLVREAFWRDSYHDDGAYLYRTGISRQGYGKILLDFSLQKAAEMGAGALCFEGNINFYGKSGFTYASAYGIRYHGLPEGADASFFLCKELKPGYLHGITGEYAPPQGYFVDEEKAAEFDKNFPYKEKLKLPGQIF
jgi:putative acetyltransferase